MNGEQLQNSNPVFITTALLLILISAFSLSGLSTTNLSFSAANNGVAVRIRPFSHLPLIPYAICDANGSRVIAAGNYCNYAYKIRHEECVFMTRNASCDDNSLNQVLNVLHSGL